MVTKQTNNYYRNFSKMCQNFEVSFIFFCFLDNLMSCVSNQRLKKANDLMYFVSVGTGKLLVEHLNKNCFICFVSREHLPGMFLVKTDISSLHDPRKIFFSAIGL